MELYRKYRETSLDGIKGNANIIATLRAIVAKDDRPHTFLFCGPAGCGKTTLAYILASEFGIRKDSLTERNSADYRGIDSVREFAGELEFMPFNGTRGYIFEECFHKDTQVATDNGDKAISDIQVGDTVVNAIGTGRVTNKFQTQVDLERVVRIDYGGKHIICSAWHRIFTSTGWKFAEEITTKDLICVTGNAMMSQSGTNKDADEKKSSNGVSGGMRRMWLPLYLAQAGESVLLKELWREVSSEAKEHYTADMPTMSKDIYGVSRTAQNPLFDVLRLCSTKYDGILSGDATFPRAPSSSIEWSNQISSDGFGEGVSAGIFGEDEKEQPRIHARCDREGICNSKEKRDTSHVSKTSDMHKLDGSHNSPNEDVRSVRDGLGNGACDSFVRPEASLVEDRRCESGAEDCSGSGRGYAQTGLSETAGCDESGRPFYAGVDSVSFYKSGDSLEHFGLCSKDIKQGYVTFYDLSVDGHPSYTANEALVHNCHRLTQEAQEALLKPVENCPENTYLFFTTTDASKINAALKTRMVIIPVEPIGDEDLSDLVHSVAKKEKIDLDDKVVEHIVASAYSSPRRALTMLEKVIGLPLEEQLQVAGYADEVDSVAIDLCRALSKRAQWSDITEILDKMTVEPEAVRRSVLGYMRKVLLKRDNPRAYLVMTAFAKNYYDSGNAGLIMSCYEARMAE